MSNGGGGSRAESRADTQRAIAEQLNAFLQNMLASPDPARAGPNVTVRALLDAATRRISESELFREQPVIEAGIRATLGDTHRALGLISEAEPHALRALEIQRAAAVGNGSPGPDLAASIHDLASLRLAQARYDEAEELFREALALRSDVPVGGAPVPADIRSSIAVLHSVRRAFDAAEQMLRRALAIRGAALGDKHYDLMRSLSSLARLMCDRGDNAAAEEYAATLTRLTEGSHSPQKP